MTLPFLLHLSGTEPNSYNFPSKHLREIWLLRRSSDLKNPQRRGNVNLALGFPTKEVLCEACFKPSGCGLGPMFSNILKKWRNLASHSSLRQQNSKSKRLSYLLATPPRPKSASQTLGGSRRP